MNKYRDVFGCALNVILEVIILGITLVAPLVLLSLRTSSNFKSANCSLALTAFFAWPLWRWSQWQRRAKARQAAQAALEDGANPAPGGGVKIERIVSGPLKKKKTPAVGDEITYRFKGAGTQATEAIDLEAGLYRIRYAAPAGNPISVRLIHRLSGDSETILAGVEGTGSQTFFVQESDRYVFQIEGGSPAWKIECEIA